MGNQQYMEHKGFKSFEEMAEQEESTVVGEVVEPTLVEDDTKTEEE
jgi:hypothetical protein